MISSSREGLQQKKRKTGGKSWANSLSTSSWASLTPTSSLRSSSIRRPPSTIPTTSNSKWNTQYSRKSGLSRRSRVRITLVSQLISSTHTKQRNKKLLLKFQLGRKVGVSWELLLQPLAPPQKPSLRATSTLQCFPAARTPTPSKSPSCSTYTKLSKPNFFTTTLLLRTTSISSKSRTLRQVPASTLSNPRKS